MPSGSFRCSDDLVNWLNATVRRTSVAYTTFLPNDPVREWKAWMEDPQNMFWSNAYLFDARRATVEKALLKEIADHRNRLSTGFVSTPYLLRIMANLAPEIGWEMTAAQDYPSWYSMTAGSDNDLMKECWSGGQALMPSLGGNLAAWHYQSLGGIRPDPTGPGFKVEVGAGVYRFESRLSTQTK